MSDYTREVSSTWQPKQDLNKDNTRHVNMEREVLQGLKPRQIAVVS